MANEKGVCAFCNRGDVGADVVGETLQADGLTVHHHCLYFSSGLEQKGEDDEGIQGFLAPDILKEIKRGQRCRLKCFVCGQRGAYVGCANKRCRKTGHFPCLNEQGFLFQFCGSFSAYCQKHRPTQPPLDFQSPRRLNCSICVCQVPAAPSFDVLYSPCCKAVLHRECIQKFALSAGGYFFRCPLCNNTDAFVNEMLRMGISVPERDATWESCGQFNDLYEETKQCTAEVCVCPKGRSFSNKLGKFKFLRCKSCGRYITHAICSDNHLIESGECRDCVLASAHNTPQATPTLYTPSSGAGNKGKNKTTPTALKSTPAHALSTAMPTVTPSTSSNVGQMLTCSCAVCEAKRGTVHGPANVKGGGGTDHKDEGGTCGARQNLPNDMPRGGAAWVQQRGTAYGGQEGGTHLTSGGQEGGTHLTSGGQEGGTHLTSGGQEGGTHLTSGGQEGGTHLTSGGQEGGTHLTSGGQEGGTHLTSGGQEGETQHGTVPTSRRKRCLEYPSDDLRPKMDKPSSSSPSPSSERGALKPPCKSNSKITIATSLPPPRSTRSAASKVVPLPVSGASLSTRPSRLPGPPAVSSAPLPSSSSSSSTSNPMETPFSRTLTYSQVMNAKATSCAKHGSNRMKSLVYNSYLVSFSSTNDADDARVDIVAENFWCHNRHKSYLDVKVFNPFAKSYVKESLTQCYRCLELDKKRAYEARVREVELGYFTPLVFSTSGGIGPAAKIFYKRLASLIAEKHDQPYNLTLFWLRAKLSFSLLRSAIMCLHGSRSSYHQGACSPLDSAIDLSCSAGRNA
ncbi:hypothetical protein EMCRGX_G014319 [Ephydatia muelleri]